MEINNVKNIVAGVINGSTTPARFYPKKNGGTIFINSPIFNKLPAAQRFFVLLHECGHAHLQTKDEREADRWAFEQYVAAGYPLSESIFALTKILNHGRADHLERIQLQFNRAVNYDIYENRNQKLKNIMDTNIQGSDANMAWVGHCYSEFLGLGKKAKERREAKQEAKIAKKEAKTAIKNARAEAITAKADAIREGTYQSGFAKIGGSIVDGAKQLLGIQRKEELTSEIENDQAKEAAAPKNKTLMIVLIVLAVIVVGFLIWKFVIKKKK